MATFRSIYTGTGATLNAVVTRRADNFQLDEADGLFRLTPVDNLNLMTETVAYLYDLVFTAADGIFDIAVFQGANLVYSETIAVKDNTIINDTLLAELPSAADVTAAIVGSQLAQNVLVSRVAVTDNMIELQEKNVKTLTYDFGAIWNLTGKKLYFTVKRDKSDTLASALINADITTGITDAAEGEGAHSITVPDEGDYHYEYTRYDNDGASNPETVMIGILKSQGSVRK